MQQWMAGRYGMDELSVAISVVALVALVLSCFPKLRLLYLPTIILWVWSLFRCCSKNLEKRRKERAEGKTILLFITCGVEPTAEYQASVERIVLPLLPDDCDYRGMFLCPGQFSDEVVQYLRNVLEQQPDNTQAQSLLAQYEKTCGHPNDSDIRRLRAFLSDNLSE
jgi:hypothetical protein